MSAGQVKTTSITLFVLSFFGIFCAFALFSGCAGEKRKKEERQMPRAKKGVLDLAGWDIKTMGQVILEGEWEFYWQALLGPGDFQGENSPEKTGYITLPGVWNDYSVDGQKLPAKGYATYKLNIINIQKGLDLGINCRYINSSYRLFINGIPIGGAGTAGVNKKESKFGVYHNLLTFEQQSSQVEIVLQVSNFYFHTGGPWDTIILGPREKMERAVRGNDLFDFFLFGALFLIALYHFSLFLMRRREKTPLFFGLLSILIAFRTIFTDKDYPYYFFQGFPGELVLRGDYISLAFSILIFALYIHSLFPAEFSKKALIFFIVYYSLFFFPVLFISPMLFTWFLYPLCLGMFILCLYIFPVVFLAIRHKREGAIFFVTSYIVAFIIIMNDILYAFTIIHTIYMMPFGLLFFTLAQSLILASRSSRAFFRVEKMTGRLKKFYKELKGKQRLQKEMEIAARIQISIIPILPKHDDLIISSLLLPAEEVGGDYYDIIFDNRNVIWFAIGDVSGHGVTSGLIMMMAQTAFSTFVKSRDTTTPGKAFIEVNKMLYHNIKNRLKEDHFMTMNFLKYRGKGKFIYAGAHTPLIIYRQKSKSCEIIETKGLFMGMIPDVTACTKDMGFYLEKEDILLLYTDGILEARKKEDQKIFFDLENLQNVLIQNAAKEPEKIKEDILLAVLEWSGGEIKDDITLMVIKRK